ncbi:GIP [Symbiodinium pilosum]|uniref:GIP protein n=1 Tax=Symbiodinium pilosum TaxID=2952 RepID=A0A812UHD6_SYMPI|nr:GIP [Symbiodinium pilosum]
MTHRPKNPYCPVCQRAKMMAPHARKLGGSSTIKSDKYGDHLTILGTVVLTTKRYVYPNATKEGEQCYENLLHFTGVDDEIGVIYSDNAPELEYAVKKLGVRHNTSREYSDENKAVIEREIRTVLEGTRAALTQAGLPDKMWPLAAQHRCIALNIKLKG